MKKYILISLLSLKLFAFDFNEDEVTVMDNNDFSVKQEKEIPVVIKKQEKPIEESSVNSTLGIKSEDVKKSVKSNIGKTENGQENEVIDNTPPFQMVNYQEVKYFKPYSNYSAIPNDKDEFMSFLKVKNYSPDTIKSYKDKILNQSMIEFNAFLYDYYLNKPNLAENYYRMFKGFSKQALVNHKIRYADFLIRTGRVSEVQNIIKKSDCLSNIKASNICFYYLGISDYLLTGNNKNFGLRTAKSSIPKAKEIYNLKKEKKTK